MSGPSKIVDSEMMQRQLDQLGQTLEVVSSTVQRLQHQVSVYEGVSGKYKERTEAGRLYPGSNEFRYSLKRDGCLDREFKQTSKHRQAARIINYLREEMQKNSQAVPIPSGRIIECLIKSCPGELIGGDNWQVSIIKMLDHLCATISSGDSKRVGFTCHDCKTPLFPNPEYFDEQDCLRFCESLLSYLTNELQISH